MMFFVVDSATQDQRIGDAIISASCQPVDTAVTQPALGRGTPAHHTFAIAHLIVVDFLEFPDDRPG